MTTKKPPTQLPGHNLGIDSDRLGPFNVEVQEEMVANHMTVVIKFNENDEYGEGDNSLFALEAAAQFQLVFCYTEDFRVFYAYNPKGTQPSYFDSFWNQRDPRKSGEDQTPLGVVMTAQGLAYNTYKVVKSGVESTAIQLETDRSLRLFQPITISLPKVTDSGPFELMELYKSLKMLSIPTKTKIGEAARFGNLLKLQLNSWKSQGESSPMLLELIAIFDQLMESWDTFAGIEVYAPETEPGEDSIIEITQRRQCEDKTGVKVLDTSNLVFSLDDGKVTLVYFGRVRSLKD